MLKSTAKLFLLAVALGLVFSGCVNTKRTYYINPDGSGKVELESISPIDKKDRSKPDFLHKNLLSFIKNSKGIDGWGKLTTEFKKGNAVAVKGVAYFKDINKLKFNNMEISDHAFNKDATGITLEFFKGKRSKKKVPAEKLDDAVKKELAEFKQIIVGFCKLKDAIRFDYTFHLPGKIGSAHIFDRLDSRKARLLITGDGVCNGLRAGMGDEKVVRAAMKTGSSEPTKRAFLKGMFGTTGHPKLVVRGPFQPLFDYEAEAIPARKYTAALLKNLPILLARSKRKRIDRERQAADPQKYAAEKREREAAKKRRAAFRRDFKGPIWRDPVTGMEFVPVLGGLFEMGCHEKARRCFGDERPAREVRLAAFWMAQLEVTQAQWEGIMGKNPSWHKKGGNYPVERVSWDNVQEFIGRLNRQSSVKFRLPSEAQWEYACRAGGKPVAFGTGNGRLSPDNANYDSKNRGTTPVGSYPANSLGLFDMTGNVAEWVQDRKTGYDKLGNINPLHESSGKDHVVRGGGWDRGSAWVGCIYRGGSNPERKDWGLGFRLVRVDAEGQKQLAAMEEKRAEEKRRQLEEKKNRRATLRLTVKDQTWLDPATGMEFVRVPGGSFQMGCHASAGKCKPNEKPVRTVRLDGFWLGKFEVTQGQWKIIMDNNPSKYKNGNDYPVERVSWDDVQEFIGRLNRQSSVKFRLPSEAQWEYACRAAGDLVKFGTDTGRLTRRNANYGKKVCCLGDDSDGYDKTSPTGIFPPNALGLHDMAGNVLEWVQDRYAWSYAKLGDHNPIHKGRGNSRVRRGGSWVGGPPTVRCSVRGQTTQTRRSANLGFRLVRMQ